MLLSIVILSYKNKNLVKELLRNIYDRQISFDYEIIVVDNNSNDGVGEYLSQHYHDVVFIKSSKNGGFAYGNNLGIKQAKGEFVMICNPDLAFLTPAIETMVSYMQDHPEVGLAGPRLINADKSLQYSCTGFPDWKLPLYRRTFFGQTESGQKWLDDYLLKKLDHYKNSFIPAIFGACMITRRWALDKVGLLDERFFMYMEDIDWSRRFWLANYKVAYIGTAEVVHLHRRESADEDIFKTIFSRTAQYHIISFIKYLIKYRGQRPPTVG